MVGLMLVMPGCERPPEQTAVKPAPVAKAEPAEPVAEAEPVVKVEPVAEALPAVPTEQLGGGTVRVVQEGPWTRRTVEREAGRMEELDGAPDGGPGGGGIGAAEEMVTGTPAPGGGPKYAKGGSSGGQPPAPKPTAAPLRAGSTDDNADHRGFLRFLATWTGRDDVKHQFQPLDVRDRGFVRVLDAKGRPVPGARIEARAAGGGGTPWRGVTYGDGRAPYYPHLYGAQQGAPALEVMVTLGAATRAAKWDGAGELTVKLDTERPAGPLTLEVLFLIDTTGSMGDEIDRIKATLRTLTAQIREQRADLTLRYGAVLYRDSGDEYLTMAHPLTEDVDAFDAALQTVTANGGGDIPEALNQGLARALDGVQWQQDAAKLVFLVCDAAPKMRVKGDVPYGDSAAAAMSRAIKVHTVAASGLDPLGTLVLRQIAQLTRGKFIFIEYGGDIKGSAKAHGVSGPVQGNNLDEILRAQIVAEIAGWGR